MLWKARHSRPRPLLRHMHAWLCPSPVPPLPPTPPAGPDDVFCLNTTVCFDPYVLYLYGCLVVGGCLVIPKPEGHVGEGGLSRRGPAGAVFRSLAAWQQAAAGCAAGC